MIGDSVAMVTAATGDGGSTNAIDAISERSASWQQDNAQDIIPRMSCPQSMCFAGAAGVF